MRIRKAFTLLEILIVIIIIGILAAIVIPQFTNAGKEESTPAVQNDTDKKQSTDKDRPQGAESAPAESPAQ
jgi:prepilin-type N-terminal cleavage/methylation domain-containing protein